ncbi:purine and uridine phosphorylase [Aspergillus pseudocaelatus]|uniref:Purine and uridine phosphorylase n=1 Tax=Aspergillus pseudocaelatus TaxID=1825620 RepID=A0ABQ6WLZ2_9EURO|nr:purine and uridine phosphorylase [Aspergillus pseudocaelatus]
MLQQDEGVVQQTRAGKPPPNSSTDEESDLEEFKEISPEAITVAIFCALSYEVVAVKYSLDEEFRCRCMAAGPQKYIYSFGRIGSHSLVIARPSQMGTVSTAQCAATVSQQFPNVRFAMMVGIGAGIPNPPSRDIRLGDIAVSIPQDNHPGVIQYDFGKYERDSFILKGSLNKPPAILISADGSLEEDEMMDRSPLRKILRSITRKSGFKRPDTGDNLFKEDFYHIENGNDCTECLASGTAELVLRDIRCRKDPVVHRGLILSGSGVVKNPQDRYRLCRDYNNAICFETGAAGIMDEIPCLVVRGICDYADTHTQDGWQYFAAATAASYCKAVLRKFDSKPPERICDMRADEGSAREACRTLGPLYPGSSCIGPGPGPSYIRPRTPYSLESVEEEIT